MSLDDAHAVPASRSTVGGRGDGRTGTAVVNEQPRPEPASLDSLEATADIAGIDFPTDRTILGPLAVAVKKTLRRLLSPILSRQVAYNVANVRVVSQLKDEIHRAREQQLAVRDLVIGTAAGTREAMEETAESLRREIRHLQEQLGAAEKAAAEANAAAASLQAELARVSMQAAQAATVDRLAHAERTLRRIVHLLTTESGSAPEGRERGTIPAEALEPPFDYYAFEQRFRGAEEYIREKQRVYLRWFEGHQNVLDVGCGRGEFLELLRDAGISATGIDTNLDMVLACREKGLHVLERDVFEHLASLPDASLGGVFAAQIVEHLESDRIVELVRLAHRKLEPGGVLIAETINPTCLIVFAESFYADFTHVRPLHPEAMRFLLEATGFRRTELHFSSPVDAAARIPPLPTDGRDGEAVEQFNRAIARLNDLLYGFRDYAVIGTKLAG